MDPTGSAVLTIWSRYEKSLIFLLHISGLGSKKDIVFVVDTSPKMTGEDITSIKRYLHNVVDDLKISQNDVRTALFTNTPTTANSGFQGLEEGSSLNQIKAYIQNFQRDYYPFDLKFRLESAEQYLSDASQIRRDAEFILVIISKDDIDMTSLKTHLKRMKRLPEKTVLVRIGKDETADSEIGDNQLKVIGLEGLNDLPSIYQLIYKFFALTKG